jgi:hypothetical protein
MLNTDSGNISGGIIARQNLGMFYRPKKERVTAILESACLK